VFPVPVSERHQVSTVKNGLSAIAVSYENKRTVYTALLFSPKCKIEDWKSRAI
jgi:hypothetical protein